MTQAAWDERYSRPDRVWSGRVNPWLAQAADRLDPGSALDLACGEGADALWLAAHGWQVTAVDFSAAAIARGARAAAAGGVEVTWLQADLSQWRPDRTFDLVAMHFLHTPDDGTRDAALRTAWAACAGTLLVVTHDPRNAADGTAGGPPDPRVLYGPSDVLRVLGIDAGSAEVVTSEVRRRETEQGTWVDGVLVLRRAPAAG